MDWIEVAIEFSALPIDWSEPVSIVHDLGCPNSRIEDEPPTLIGCFPDLPGVEQTLAELKSRLDPLGACQYSEKRIKDEDWIEVFKQHFKRRQIGDQLLLLPTWDEDPVETGLKVIRLDPGQAFGTGDHPTTQMCLELMQTLPLEGKTIVDIGCGTGILGIAALKSGARSVHGIDIEPASVEVAQSNGKVNGIEYSIQLGSSPLDLKELGPFDVAFSNIISATLLRFAPLMPQLLNKGGFWLVSGIIPDNWPDVEAAAVKSGFRLISQSERDGWVAALFQLN